MINWIGIIEELSGKSGWEDAEGPHSGVGESYWYGMDDEVGNEIFARLNLDQGHGYIVLIDHEDEDDNETLWEGDVESLSADPKLMKFVQETANSPTSRSF